MSFGPVTKVTHRPKSPWFLVQNAIYSIGGMELRPLEDLATSQEGLVSPTQLTDLYLLYHRFVFVTENVWILIVLMLHQSIGSVVNIMHL